MARQPRKMAKLNNSESSLPFAAAVTAITLGTGKRLMRNFVYYKQETGNTVYREDCIQILKEIRLNVFGLQNLCLDDDYSNGTASFKVMLAKQIQDDLEQLHRHLLFFDVEDIVEIIQIVDRLRAFWTDSSEAEFYESNLSARLDRQVVAEFNDLRDHLHNLPLQSD